MTTPRIVITRPLPGDPLARFRAAGFDNLWINPDDTRLTRARLLEVIAGADAVLATPADVEINAEFFDAAGPQLKVVSNYAVGVDNIDLAEAARRNVIIGHTPHAVTEPTADIAWLLLLGAAKRAYEGQRLVRSGEWSGVGPNELLGLRLVGKTLLIVGAGRIGYATARRALGWDMNILYNARSVHEDFESDPLNAERVDLHDGLRCADIISLHTPLTDETHHLIGADELALLKPIALLINTARGPVIDERALVDALRNPECGPWAAGLDVFEEEPKLTPGLAALDNVYLLPHLGSATVEDRIWMMEIAVDNTIAALNDQPLPHEFPRS